MSDIALSLRFKNKDKMEPATMYLGASMELKELNGKKIWTISLKEYLKAALEIVKQGIKKREMKFSNRVITPMSNDYYPELDGTVD